MTNSATESLEQKLERACGHFDPSTWLNIRADILPWSAFPRLQEPPQKSIKELLDESRRFISFFEERRKGILGPKGIRNHPTSESRPRTIRIQGEDATTYLPRDTESDQFLSEVRNQLRLCILLNTLGRPDLIQGLKEKDSDLPFLERELTFLSNVKDRSLFLSRQQLFIKRLKPTMITELEDELAPLKQVQFIKSGNFASVFKANDVITMDAFALKKFRFRLTRRDSSDKENVRKEVLVLQKLRGHRHIVQLHGSYIGKKEAGIVLQPVADSNLQEYLDNFYDPDCPSGKAETLYRVFGCLCVSLEKMHQSRIRHKDIKPANILINGSDVLYTGYNSALLFQDSKGFTRSPNGGERTDMYAPPERWDEDTRDVTADVFSLGCVFLEVLTVLAGEELEECYELAQPVGYGQNLDGIQRRLEELERRVKDKEWLLRPIRWCSRMLGVKAQRPGAAEVIDEIVESTPEEDLEIYFCAPCCQEIASRSKRPY
jgi:tRNA A-37 threonylcarbamoyl transferase component Bud32